jgi:hypothetical protein
VFNEQKSTHTPKEFTLFGHKYTIVFRDDLLEKENCYGSFDEDLKVLEIQRIGMAKKVADVDGEKVLVDVNVTRETFIETFFHELVHAMLESSGEEELSQNERFVNMMGKCLLEIYLSSVYEKDSGQEKDA